MGARVDILKPNNFNTDYILLWRFDSEFKAENYASIIFDTTEKYKKICEDSMFSCKSWEKHWLILSNKNYFL